MSIWLQIGLTAAMSLVTGAVGAFCGSWLTAYRIGRWQQKVESWMEVVQAEIRELRTEAHNNTEARIANAQELGDIQKRLDRGGMRIDEVPVHAAKLEAVTTELREIKLTLRAELPRLVSKDECERRHERDA